MATGKVASSTVPDDSVTADAEGKLRARLLADYDPVTPQPWWALAGVVVGFCLGEGSRYLRYRLEIFRNKRLVKEELRSVLSQLPQKIDVLRQAIEKLRGKQFLPILSVHLVATGYNSVLSQLYPHLTFTERNCLHVIYERLRVADEAMDAFENDFTRAVKDKVIGDPCAAAIGRLEDLVHSLGIVEELAKSYVAAKPVDVFGVSSTGR
jgi:hypothetical protein